VGKGTPLLTPTPLRLVPRARNDSSPHFLNRGYAPEHAMCSKRAVVETYCASARRVCGDFDGAWRWPKVLERRRGSASTAAIRRCPSHPSHSARILISSSNLQIKYERHTDMETSVYQTFISLLYYYYCWQRCRRRQTTPTDDSVQNHTGPLGGPVIMRYIDKDNWRFQQLFYHTSSPVGVWSIASNMPV